VRLRTPRWASLAHPVYRLEAQRRLENRSLLALRLGCVPSIFAATGLVLIAVAVTVFLSQFAWLGTWQQLSTTIPLLLGWVVGAMVLIQIGAGAIANILTIAQAAPMISGEVELQSWGLLRTTTLTLREIFFAKYAAALNQLRAPLFGLMMLRLASVLTALLLFAYVILRDTFYYWYPEQWLRFWQEAQWFPPLVAVFMVVLVYTNQPILQWFLNGAIGLTASAYAPTRGQAIAAGLVGRLALWVITILTNVACIYLLTYSYSQWTGGYYLSSFTTSYPPVPTPTPLEVNWVTCLTIAGYMAAVLASQIGVTLLLLGVAQRRARLLGGAAR
jgi:hypothetical protein